jgi:hypothetical protein
VRAEEDGVTLGAGETALVITIGMSRGLSLLNSRGMLRAVIPHCAIRSTAAVPWLRCAATYREQPRLRQVVSTLVQVASVSGRTCLTGGQDARSQNPRSLDKTSSVLHRFHKVQKHST